MKGAGCEHSLYIMHTILRVWISSSYTDFQEVKLAIYVNTTLIEQGNNITYVFNLIHKFTTTSQVVRW